MKLLIGSDLHGSAYWTEQLLCRMEKEQPDQLILLGDLLYHGPRNDLPRGYDTKKTAALLNSVKKRPLCVRGNCDGEVDQMVLDFPVLCDFAVVLADGHSFYLTHGHHLDQASKAVRAGNTILYGHTHLPDYREEDGVLLVNPGSVSIPKNGSLNSFLVITNGTFQWKDVSTGETWREEKI